MDFSAKRHQHVQRRSDQPVDIGDCSAREEMVQCPR